MTKAAKSYGVIALITIFFFISLAELWSRFHYRNLDIMTVDEEQLSSMQKFPETKQLSADRKKLRTGYHDYYLYSFAELSTKTINISDYYSARVTPDSSQEEAHKYLIWVFGGSTLIEIGTKDEFTIANQIALNLNKRKYHVRVLNFGAGSFQSSMESIKFQDLLRRINKKEHPNVVIFYDGFNDSQHAYLYGAGNLQQDLSLKLKALVTGNEDVLLFYLLSNKISKVSWFWKYFIGRRLDNKLFGGYMNDGSKSNIEKALDMYEANTRMIRAICTEFKIKPVFILQPMIFTKSGPTEFEKSIESKLDQNRLAAMKTYYELISKRMIKYNDFYNLSDILNSSINNDFWDFGHIGPYSGTRIGNKISEIVSPLLDK